jgi:hypothetical protein
MSMSPKRRRARRSGGRTPRGRPARRPPFRAASISSRYGGLRRGPRTDGPRPCPGTPWTPRPRA